MANETTTIAESSYIFNDAALKLSENFFEVEDVSLLKVGMFGYTTSVLSSIMRNSVYHRDQLYNEMFLVSANLNSTLYNYSKILNGSVELATPSQMPVAIKISLDDLQNIATASSIADNTSEYVIDRGTIFDAGGYKFLLPCSLRILFSRSSTGMTHISAVYDINTYNFNDGSLNTPYVKTTLIDDGGVAYVVISATIYQIERRDWVFTMASNDILDVGIIEQNYGENLVNFRALYSENSASTGSFVEIETIFNEVNKNTTDKFAYYTFIGGDTLRLFFSNKSGDFRPAFNSKVKIETFTTSAELGNIDYAGTIAIRDTKFEDVRYSCVPLVASATGGTSVKSFRDSKIALMEKMRTRDNYTTTYDLDTYFKNIKKTSLKSNSDFRVVKLRDDIFRRQFSLFVLQRTTSGELVPTNTINLQFTLEEIESFNYSLKPGTMIVYDRIESRYRVLSDEEYPEAYLANDESYLFCIPFLINFNFKEFPKANIYFTNYDLTIPTAYDYVNVNSPYDVVINNIEVARNPVYDIDNFNISTYLNTTSVNLNTVKIRLVISQGGVSIGYADLARVGETSEFKLIVKTEDSFDIDGNYLLLDTFKDISTAATLTELRLHGSYDVKLGVFVPDAGSTILKPAVFQSMTDLNDYSLVVSMDTTEQVSFADDLTDIMYCALDFDEMNGRMSLSSVPVVGAISYLNASVNKNIMADFYQHMQIVRNVSSSLENNTTIDIKYFNTSGVSKYFDVDTTDLRMKLTIALSVSVTKDFEDRINTYIAEFVESTNNQTEKRFSMSNLIKNLENNFSEIRYIKLSTVNGGNIQNIEQIQYTDTHIDELPTSYVPEFINIRKRQPRSNSSSYYDYAIDIDYL
jgi:hypothetical protein